jgi:hypothetical protein
VRSGVALALMLALLLAAADANAQVRAGASQVPAAGDLFVLTAEAGSSSGCEGVNACSGSSCGSPPTM